MMRLRKPWKVRSLYANDVDVLVLYEMSQLLNCGVDQRTLTLLVALIENGVNSEALANVVKELQRETRALKVCAVFILSHNVDGGRTITVTEYETGRQWHEP